MVVIDAIKKLLSIGLTPIPVVDKAPIIAHKNGKWREFIHEHTLSDNFTYGKKNISWNKCDVGVLLEDHIVIDCDSEERYEELRSKFPEIDKAPLVDTMKGKHIWFKRTSELDGYYDRADAFENLNKVDFKTICSTGTSGMIVTPPSKGKTWIRELTSDNCYPPSPQFIAWIKENHKDKPKAKPKITKKREPTTTLTTDMTEIQIGEYLDMLAPSRADDYHDWTKVGSILHNYDLFNLWDKWSSQSTKYNADECADKWSSLGGTNLSIGALVSMARSDNAEQYAGYHNTWLRAKMLQSLTGLSQDCAEVLSIICNGKYVCVDIKRDIWYKCTGYWKLDSSPLNMIGKQMLDEYLKLCCECNKLSFSASTEEERKKYLDQWKDLTDVTYKLRDIVFKQKIIAELRHMLFDINFMDKLDTNPYLLGFDDVVYDLNKHEPREYMPEDYVSLTVGYNYPEEVLDEGELLVFLSQVLPIDTVRNYVCRMCSTLLEGLNTREKFYTWWGEGGNGKSKLIELLHVTLGDYACTLPIDILTCKTFNSGEGASPNLVACRGKRLVTSAEPEDGVKYNASTLKSITGNDIIKARPLYGIPMEFKFNAKLIIACNARIKFNGRDGGMIRRVEFVQFSSRFVHNPDPAIKNQFKINEQISLKRWKVIFMQFLLREYKLYREFGLVVCDEVKETTLSYINDNDELQEFIDNTICKSDDGNIKCKELWDLYKCSENYNKATKMKEFKSSISHTIGPISQCNHQDVWKGWKYKNSDAEPKLNELID